MSDAGIEVARVETDSGNAARMLALVLDAIPARVFWKDRNLVYTGCNRAFALDAGLPSPEAIVGKTDFEMPWLDQADIYRADDHAVMESGQAKTSYEEPQTTPDGHTIWLRTSKVPLRDAAGQIQGIMGTYEEITEHKQAVEAQKLSEERFRDLFERVPVGVYRSNASGKILMANPALCAMLRCQSMSELLESDITRDFYVDPTARSAAVEKLSRDGQLQNSELRLKRKDGRVITVLENSRMFQDPATGESYYEGMLVDITERKQAEEALLREREFTDRFIEVVPGIFFVLDERRRYLRWNVAHEELYGLPPERIRQLDALNQIHEDDRARVEDGFRKLMTTGAAEVEARAMVRNSAETRDFRLTGRRLEVDGKLFVVGCGIDITEQKAAEAERARLEERLRQAQRLDSIGRLAGGVAHDFNNNLTVINGYCDILLSQLSEGEPARAMVEQIRKSGERATLLTNQLLAFGRKQVLEPQPLSLNDVVVGLQGMLCRLIREDIEIVTRLAPDLGTTVADRGQMEQVLMNLVVNARDAMPGPGKVIVETANLDFEVGRDNQLEEMRGGPAVLLAVTDTGLGMSEETKRFIFEPFFTTKDTGKGTGLGLAVVYGIVKQTGGTIVVQSEPGKGSTFKVFLPRVQTESPAAAPHPAEDQKMSPDSGRILVVEDQEAVRRLLVEVLRATGYTVLEAARGTEALALPEDELRRIDLVVSDVVMPEMSGYELANRLAQVCPGIGVLLVSGYAPPATGQEGIHDSGIAFLPKPFTPSQIKSKVREMLAARRGGGRGAA